MADLESIIQGSLDAATDDVGGDLGDATDVGDVGGTEEPSGGAESVDAGTEGVEGTGADAEALAAAEAAQKVVEDAFAKEHGINPQDQRKRENRIPYSQVKKIAANAEKKLAEIVLGANLAGDKPLADQLKSFATTYSDLQRETEGIRSQLAEVNQVEQIMLQRPEQFLELLPHINPKFAELLGNRGGQTREPAPVDLPKPDLKVKLPDGTEASTFSPEGLANYVKALVAQTRDAVLKEVDGKVKPFVDERTAAQTNQQMMDRLFARVEHAKANWKGFKEWEKDIQAVMREDRMQAQRTRTAPKLDLQDAYIQVRDKKHEEELAKYKLDHETHRKQIIDEINKRPKSTAAAAGRSVGKQAASADGPKTIEDVIKESMAGLK